MSDRFLHVDPILCVGHGLCAEMLPEVIALDDWGFPMISPDPVPRHLSKQAGRTRAACPALALRVDRNPDRRAQALHAKNAPHR